MNRLEIISLLLLFVIVKEFQCRLDKSSTKYQLSPAKYLHSTSKYTNKGSSKKSLSLPIYFYTLESKNKPNLPASTNDFQGHFKPAITRELLFNYYTHGVAKKRFKRYNLSPNFWR